MVRRSNKWIAEILSSTSGNDNDKQLAFDIQAFTYRPRLDELPPSLLSLLSLLLGLPSPEQALNPCQPFI